MEENKKKIGFKIHLIIAAVMVVVVAVVFIRLNIWSKRSVTVENNSTPGEYRSENLDYIIYRTDDQPVREPDGVTRAVILGNYMVNSYRNEKSILNMLKAGLDWEFIDLSIDRSLIASSSVVREEKTYTDDYCLYSMAESLVRKVEFEGQENAPFEDDVDRLEFAKRWRGTDLDKADYVIIMYALMDYYYGFPAQPATETEENTYDTCFGSLYNTILLLQKWYPHLQIVVVSGYPEYYVRDGVTEYAYSTDYGNGTMSKYASIESFAAMTANVTYIDNFYCGINEDNIREYVDEMNLTDKGVELVGGHILEKLKLLQ